MPKTPESRPISSRDVRTRTPARGIRVLSAVLVSIAALVHAIAGDETEARQHVLRTMMEAGDVATQAEAVANLAWPGEGVLVGDDVRAEARAEIVVWGARGMPAMHRIVRTRPEHCADALAALLEAQTHTDFGIPPSFLPALEDAVWFGSSECRRLAIQEWGKRPDCGPVQLPMIDATFDEPDLVPVVLTALGTCGNDRARYWISTFFEGDHDEDVQGLAAVALASMGGRSLAPLQSAMLSDRPALRQVAVQSYVAVAGIDELMPLYEYLGAFPDDDPGLIEMVREKAVELERILEAIREETASTPTPD